MRAKKTSQRTPRGVALGVQLLVVACAYVLGARLGLSLAVANENVTAIWPPTGIAVAALWLGGRRLWPGVAAGALIANATNGLSIPLSIVVAVGNTLAPLAAVTLLDRLNVRRCFRGVRDVLVFFAAAPIPMLISASVGTVVLMLAGVVDLSAARSTFLLWWMGDTMGVVLYAPLLLTFLAIPRSESPVLRHPVHTVLLVGGAAVATVFALRTDPAIRYLLLPLALWMAMYLEQQGAAAAALVMSTVAIWQMGHEPRFGTDVGLVILQGLNTTLILTLLSFAAVMYERRRAQEESRRLADELEDRVRERTQDLLDSERRLQEAQRLARIGSFQWDAASDTNLWTDELFEIYGLPKADGPPGFEDYLSFVDPDHRDQVRASVEATIAAGGSIGHEYPIVLGDGSRKWVHAHVDVLLGPDGGLTELRGTCQDITDRKEVDIALHASEERFRALLASAPDAMVVADEQGLIVLVNDEVSNLLGYAKEELVGHPVELLLPEALRRSHAGERDAYSREPRRRPMGAGRDLSARRRDGTLVPVDVSLSPVQSEDGLLVFASLRDATQRRQVEDALRTALDRETEAARYLRKLDASKNDFLSAVSHELRTPLTSILGFVQLLRESELDESTRTDMLARVDANAQRLERLLGDLLDIDRLHRGIIEPRRRRSDLRSIVDAALATMDLRDHPLSIEATEAEVLVDPAHAERIVENLVSNAVKYTQPGSRIWVEAEPDGTGGVAFRVSDEGPGIPADLREEIFEPFFHGAGNTFARGTGIGLALVDRFARLHGGRAWVTDRPGGGSKFHVVLPGPTDANHPAVA